jgi:acyl-CoA synthetase (AMP-forming)/AMP-acid ligase II
LPSPPSLPAALQGHAARDREEPWLFHPEGWDWRWLSWGEIAAQVDAGAASLAVQPAGSPLSFSYSPRPEFVVYDLAVQAAGLVSVPSSSLQDLPVGGGGGAMVMTAGAPVVVEAAELVAMAERVQGEIAPPRKAYEREIVVLGGPLERMEERAMLSWATVTGAAVALEPTPGSRVATAAWVRPTVFHGTPEEIGGLRVWVEKKGRGWLRRPGLPFGRLRTVLVVGEEGIADEGFWTERGVRVGRVP